MLNVKKRQRITLILVICCVLYLFIAYMNKQQKEENNDEAILSRDYVMSQRRLRPNLKVYRATTKKPELVKITHYHEDNVKPLRGDTHVVKLKTRAGNTPIVVYKPEVDNMISAFVRDYGTWEEDMLNETARFLRTDRDMMFLDIGCNIGVYTLFVAKLGIKVVAIDAVEDNMRLLTESMRLGNLTHNVHLIFNAISDSHKTVSIRIPPENIGGAHIDDVINKNGDANHNVHTITLDDLSQMLKGRSVFIKMDIEGSEARAISAAHEFFQTVNVRGILMEWMHHRRQESGQVIIDTLVHNGLFPYTDISRSEFLDPDRYYTWPENVFWIKR